MRRRPRVRQTAGLLEDLRIQATSCCTAASCPRWRPSNYRVVRSHRPPLQDQRDDPAAVRPGQGLRSRVRGQRSQPNRCRHRRTHGRVQDCPGAARPDDRRILAADLPGRPLRARLQHPAGAAGRHDPVCADAPTSGSTCVTPTCSRGTRTRRRTQPPTGPSWRR